MNRRNVGHPEQSRGTSWQSLRSSYGVARLRFATLGMTLSALALFMVTAPAATILEETVRESFEVDSDSTLSISNTDGSIRIYAADVTQMSLTAIKKAYTAERLHKIDIAVTADRREVVIKTTFPAAPDNWTLKDRSGTVEYTLIVPPTTRVTKCDLVNGEVLVEGLRGGSAKAHLVNGWLSGHNCFADLDLSIVNGKLDVAYDWWENKTFSAKAESVNGSIRAIIPSDASLKIDARSAHGHVTSALPAGDASKDHSHAAPSLSFELGEGEGRQLRMNALHGNIKIEKAY